MRRALPLALLSLGLTLTAPLWLHLEPSPRYPSGGVWLELIYAPGHLVLVAVALRWRRLGLSGISLLHAAWLITAQLAFSTQGEIWSAIQLLLSNLSALVCVGLWLAHHHIGEARDSEGLGRYALACLLGAALVFAGLTTSRAAVDAAQWGLVHREAARMARHVRAHGDAQGYRAELGWAAEQIRTAPCEGGGFRVSYGGNASHSYHQSCGSQPDGWFYYPD